MAVTLRLPRISMNMVEATIVRWHVTPGDRFKKGDILCEIETEKVTTDYEAEGEGEMLEILAKSGAEIEVGSPICRVRPL
jgi:pyruvate/2-oxoglutarate dehydrogenase complex dihydrolipoamide acyltransferase (E2) component